MHCYRLCCLGNNCTCKPGGRSTNEVGHCSTPSEVILGDIVGAGGAWSFVVNTGACDGGGGGCWSRELHDSVTTKASHGGGGGISAIGWIIDVFKEDTWSQSCPLEHNVGEYNGGAGVH